MFIILIILLNNYPKVAQNILAGICTYFQFLSNWESLESFLLISLYVELDHKLEIYLDLLIILDNIVIVTLPVTFCFVLF